ncbi:cell division protein ZipA [Vibrio anguillarum]|uniref:Cell division protein ZipA n=1 Tax=Vibrio anguillarum TaxID=55601 RepID=A0ABR9YZ89_VIBAN|nr:cell division protein ZipA [Vibrio anguillarum]MBF4243955.1 cell division protein ZipA [Vibrio anguillarum]MBF4371522.1 cell division protein ZipA [Vibrio anguillarum]
MQELRFVLIIVGALAIAALLFHGLWTSKKEGKSKFEDKPLGKIDVDHDDTQSATQRSFAPEDDFEIIRKVRKEPDFSEAVDPLIDGYSPSFEPENVLDELDDVPSISMKTESPSLSEQDDVIADDNKKSDVQEAEMEVIVLNVHCAGNDPFVGTKLFDSMQQNGLLYGEMDIFHRHADLSGTGKVLFSVANMMQPGTLAHHDPAEFTTRGISFFMTLPCYGEPDQNFKLMLKTAQQIADDLGGNVLDDARNLMTPDRLAAYRRQIQEFKSARNA